LVGVGVFGHLNSDLDLFKEMIAGRGQCFRRWRVKEGQWDVQQQKLGLKFTVGVVGGRKCGGSPCYEI